MSTGDITTVRVVTDIRTYDPEELMKIIKQQNDGVGDHLVSIVLPSMGFEGKAQAGGTFVHAHEENDRNCRTLAEIPRMYRSDGQDEL